MRFYWSVSASLWRHDRTDSDALHSGPAGIRVKIFFFFGIWVKNKTNWGPICAENLPKQQLCFSEILTFTFLIIPDSNQKLIFFPLNLRCPFPSWTEFTASRNWEGTRSCHLWKDCSRSSPPRDRWRARPLLAPRLGLTQRFYQNDHKQQRFHR